MINYRIKTSLIERYRAYLRDVAVLERSDPSMRGESMSFRQFRDVEKRMSGHVANEDQKKNYVRQYS
jgi:hypothetical protein